MCSDGQEPSALHSAVVPAFSILPCQHECLGWCAGAAAVAGPAAQTAGMGLEQGAPSVEELLWRAEAHAQPRPLIGNRRIEAVPEPSWDPHLLGFPALVCLTLLLCTA